MIVGFAIAIAGYLGIEPPGFVAEVVAFAFGLAAASFFLAILLGIFDKRTNREAAIAGIIVGLLFTIIYIVGIDPETRLDVGSNRFSDAESRGKYSPLPRAFLTLLNVSSMTSLWRPNSAHRYALPCTSILPLNQAY